MPSFKDGQPYGYTCFARLFGKGKKPVVYAPVEVKQVLRRWADLKDNMSPEGWEMKKDHFTVNYVHRFMTVQSKPLVAQSEFAIQDTTGQFWIPKDELKKALLGCRVKLGISSDVARAEFKAIGV
jgi:hypothetical protein